MINKKKKFKDIRAKLKSRGFAQRVSDRSDKEAVCAYLNDEIKRHVQSLYEQREKSQQAYAAEKTRIRRQIRQEQSERAKNAKAEKTKVQIDGEKEEALRKLKEKRD